MLRCNKMTAVCYLLSKKTKNKKLCFGTGIGRPELRVKKGKYCMFCRKL